MTQQQQGQEHVGKTEKSASPSQLESSSSRDATVCERPILFSAEMVRALLDDSKTQTRRVVKPQPPEWVETFGYTCFTPRGSISGRGTYGDEGPAEKFFACPYGAVGDRLWVRETLRESEEGGWVYAADGAPIEMYEDDPRVPAMVSWAHHVQRDVCVSIHMPRWASRLTLEITAVRVERVQEISEEDAIAEGVETDIWDQALVVRKYDEPDAWFQMWSGDISNYVDLEDIHRASYRTLWDSLNAKRGFGWNVNPFVWVIEFRRVPL